MTNFTITASAADIKTFATVMFWLCFAGAAIGAGLIGLLRGLLAEFWYWHRASRRLARMQRREVARG